MSKISTQVNSWENISRFKQLFELMLNALKWEANDFWEWALFRIFFSDRLNLAVIYHFDAFVGAEAITAGKELLADARFTKKHVVLEDMRSVTSMSLYDTDWAFGRQAREDLRALLPLRSAQLFEIGNPINDIHKERCARLSKYAPNPNQLQTLSLSEAAGWLGLDEKDLGSFIWENL